MQFHTYIHKRKNYTQANYSPSGIVLQWFTLLFLTLLIGFSFAQSKSEKRGIGYGYHSVADMNTMKPGISWWYNWYFRPDSALQGIFPDKDVAFVPMVWGGNFNVNEIIGQIPTGTKYLLGFNEPNFKEQSNLTPQMAAAIWPQLEQIAHQKNLKIVGPAVNYCGGCVDIPGTDKDNDPTAYLDAFFAACPTCQVDYIAVHWYSCYRSALEWYIGLFKKYGKPLWLTEFACWEGNPTLEAQTKYMKEAVDYLESEPNVFRYAWFTGRSETPNISLFTNTSGQLSSLGQLYISLPFKPSQTTKPEKSKKTDKSLILNATISPNPLTGDHLSIRFENYIKDNIQITVSIIDMRGRTCYEKITLTGNVISFDKLRLKSGIYVVRLHTSNANSLQKLIVQ